MGEVSHGATFLPERRDLREDDDTILMAHVRVLAVIADDLIGLYGLEVVSSEAFRKAETRVAQNDRLDQLEGGLSGSLRFRPPSSARTQAPVLLQDLLHLFFDLVHARSIFGEPGFVAHADVAVAIEVLVQRHRFACEHPVGIREDETGTQARCHSFSQASHLLRYEEGLRGLIGGMEVDSDQCISQKGCELARTLLFIAAAFSLQNGGGEAAIQIRAVFGPPSISRDGAWIAESEKESAFGQSELPFLEMTAKAVHDFDTRTFVSVNSSYDAERRARHVSLDSPDHLTDFLDVVFHA